MFQSVETVHGVREDAIDAGFHQGNALTPWNRNSHEGLPCRLQKLVDSKIIEQMSSKKSGRVYSESNTQIFARFCSKRL